MNYVDVVILGFIVYGAYKGFSKGFIIEIASLFALVFGLIGAILFSSPANAFLKEYFPYQNLPSIIAFILTFIVIIIIINIIARFLTKVIKMGALGGVNKILGAFIGGLKFAIILSVIALLIDQFQFIFSFVDNDIIEESILYEPIKGIGEVMLNWLIGKKDLLPENLI